MKVTETREIIKCDMCKEEVLETEYHVILLKDVDWDLCRYCVPKLDQSLLFISTNVGLPIDYRFKVMSYEERMND